MVVCFAVIVQFDSNILEEIVCMYRQSPVKSPDIKCMYFNLRCELNEFQLSTINDMSHKFNNLERLW